MYVIVSQVAWKHRQIREEFDDNKVELMKLTQMIKLQEEALLEINKNHETAMQRRNFLYVPILELTLSSLNSNQGSKLHLPNIVSVCVTYSGIQLLEREELLATYNKQVDINDAAITEGQMALGNLEKEMRDIKLELSEEKRQLELKRKEALLKQRLEEEITVLQTEVGKVKVYIYINLLYTFNCIKYNKMEEASRPEKYTESKFQQVSLSMMIDKK